MITSLSNPRIKAIRRLRDRKAREEGGSFLAEGLRIVIEAVQQRAMVETLVVCSDLLTSVPGKRVVEEQRQQGVEVLDVSQQVFRSIAMKEEPVGIAAVIPQRWVPLEQVGVHPGDLWVALDEVADPGNLGSILRTLDAVGGKGLLLLGHTTDPYDPTSIRASMGAIFSLALCRTSFAQFAGWKKASQIPLVGTSGAAQSDYQDIRYPDGLVLLMGSEREGLPAERVALCDQMVRIPMVGRSDSLNLAVATSVTLYEIFNQQRKQRAPL
jgi:RNA methyltransferase, TrmH family